MAGEIISPTVAVAIAKIVSTYIMPALRPVFIMAELVNRDFQADLQSEGDTVTVPMAPTMTANNIAEAGQVQLQNPALGSVDVTLTQHIESSFFIPDHTRILARPDLIQGYMTSAVLAVAQQIETDLMGLFPYFTYNSQQGTAGTALTEAVIDATETSLFNSKVPEGEPRNLVLSSLGYSDVRQIPRFTERRMIGGLGEAIRTGQVSDLKNFRVVRSQLTPVTTGSPNTYYNLAFHRDAMALVTRRLPSIPPGFGAVSEYVEDGGYGFRVVLSYNPNELGIQCTVDCLYGVGILRPEFAVTLVR